MPGMDGYEVCRRIRADPATEFLPVVMITASGEQEKRRAIEAGADDFITKPFDQAELLARVRSLLRIKRYHDEIEAYNRGLRRFLPPEVAELVKADPSVLACTGARSRCSSAGCTASPRWPSSAEPEDVMGVLDAYHAALGELIDEAEGTLVAPDRRRADGRPQRPAAVRGPGRRGRPARARAARPGVGAGRGLDPARLQLQLAGGVALGHATIGRIGSDRRWEYAPVGRVPTLAERLCESAEGGQILLSQRAFAATEGLAITQEVGELELRGFSKPARAYDLLGLEHG